MRRKLSMLSPYTTGTSYKGPPQNYRDQPLVPTVKVKQLGAYALDGQCVPEGWAKVACNNAGGFWLSDQKTCGFESWTGVGDALVPVTPGQQAVMASRSGSGGAQSALLPYDGSPPSTTVCDGTPLPPTSNAGPCYY